MSLSFDAPASAQIASGVVGAHWLVDLDFSGGMVRATTAPVAVTVGGSTYSGLGGLLEISAVSESEDTQADRLTLSIPIVDTAMLAAVMADASTYRGRSVVLWLQLFSDTFAAVGEPKRRWRGVMDPARVSRSPRADGVGSGRIELPCIRIGTARWRDTTGLRHTHAQQIRRYPGDMGLQYMQSLIEAPALWLSKRFQEM